MHRMPERMLRGTLLAMALLLVAGCSPEVGSEAWCTQMKEKPKGDWTASEAGEFARNCVIRIGG